MSDRRPILVFGAVNDATLPPPFLELSIAHTRTISESLADVGIEFELVDTSHHVPPLEELCDMSTAGLVLLGGGDVDPVLYGHIEDESNLYGVNRDIDEMAIALIHHALRNEIPILAICRGAQLINVARGGTLIPDIEDWALHRGASADAVFVYEAVRLADDSRLAGILGKVDIEVLNGHHQAIDAVGHGVQVTGLAKDGIIEAIEVEGDAWVVGVQWHPEHKGANPQDRSKLFSSFAAAIRTRQEQLKAAADD